MTTGTKTSAGLLALAIAAGANGCYFGRDGFEADPERTPGGNDDGDDDGGSADDGGDSGDPDPESKTCARAGAAPPRLLTRDQYRATTRDLLGLDLDVTEGFLPDAQVSGYWNNEDQPMTVSAAEQYMRAAEGLASAVELGVLAPCDVEGGDDPHACAEDFIAELAPRAYRRPLDDAQLDRLLALYDEARSDPDLALSHDDAVRVVLRAILQSPFFVSHIELGDATRADADGNAPLTGHELASRLSYTL